ncbi:MAG TPA: serine hydrolase domain-containing protein [Thermoanaerobaculia bacterium]|nr:serine hydrolase domain-containing protein [Thermoanaerobaculia bacterium]
MRITTIVAALFLFTMSAQAHELEGLWRAKKIFGPEVRGMLVIEKEGEAWRAEIAGRSAPVRVEKDAVTFALADDEGEFRGQLQSDRIVGHWIQPRGVTVGYPHAIPVTLLRQRANRWRGEVSPLEDSLTHFLPIVAKPDGTLALYLRNPDRNIGRFFGLQRLTVEDSAVKVYGARGNAPERLMADGQWDEENDRLSIDFPNGGGYFDFRRATPADERVFYPRGKSPAPYVYRKPPLEDDGWAVASADEVGLSRAAIAKFAEFLIATPIDSLHSQEVHALLIARHGKLAVEEYFHGFDRDSLHDTRSAAKVLADVLAGAAMQHGAKLSGATPVFATMGAEGPPSITLAHLLSMSSGLDCDDSNPDSAGNEDRMQDEHSRDDWTALTLALPPVRKPGEKAVYCSMSANLAGNVVAKVTQRWLPDLFRETVADPLQIRHYALNLAPSGQAYMGGGARLTARDFLKLAQLMLDGGKWHGKQVIPAAWVKESLEPRMEMAGIRYGYLWWHISYPYEGRNVEAFFAGGNGGQISMAIPELDVALVFFGGNYGDAVAFAPQQKYVPEFILPAAKIPGS